VISSASPGLLSSTQRRGVTPLVMLWNLPGSSSKKSRSTVRFRSSVCSAATPLIARLPTAATCAMRTARGPCSSMSDMRAARSSSPGKTVRTRCRKRRLIS